LGGFYFSKHLSHIFDEGELNKDTTVSKMEIVVNRGFRVTQGMPPRLAISQKITFSAQKISKKSHFRHKKSAKNHIFGTKNQQKMAQMKTSVEA